MSGAKMCSLSRRQQNVGLGLLINSKEYVRFRACFLVQSWQMRPAWLRKLWNGNGFFLPLSNWNQRSVSYAFLHLIYKWSCRTLEKPNIKANSMSGQLKGLTEWCVACVRGHFYPTLGLGFRIRGGHNSRTDNQLLQSPLTGEDQTSLLWAWSC